MLAIIAGFFGFLSSGLPHVLSFLQDKKDKAHEVELLKLQLEQAKITTKGKVEEIQIASDSAEMTSLYQTYKTNITWVDAYNGTVRPTLAYSFFFLYAALKFILAQYLYRTNAPIAAFTDMLWTELDMAIFSAIISFYYGQRAFHKLKG